MKKIRYLLIACFVLCSLWTHAQTWERDGALVLDGTDDYVTIRTNFLEVIPLNQSFTIEFWCKPGMTTPKANTSVICGGGNGANGTLYIGYDIGWNMTFSFWGNQLQANKATNDYNQWVHWAFVYIL